MFAILTSWFAQIRKFYDNKDCISDYGCHKGVITEYVAVLLREQSGAAEACWAHNPEVDGSKPSSARYTFLS